MAWWRDVMGRLRGPTTPEAVETQASAEAEAQTDRSPQVNEEPMTDANTPHNQPEPSPRQALSDYSVQDDVKSIDPDRRRPRGSDAMSRIYARALLEMGEEKGRLDEIAAEVDQVRELLDSDASLRQLLSTPAIGVAERRDLLGRLFQGRVSDTTYKFLQVVNAKDRLGALPAILAAFSELVDERRGIVEVDVYVAERLDAGEADAVARRVGAALRKEVVLHQYVNPDLIGGLVIRVGDQLIDGSVATQLKLMRQKLIEAGRNRARNTSL